MATGAVLKTVEAERPLRVRPSHYPPRIIITIHHNIKIIHDIFIKLFSEYNVQYTVRQYDKCVSFETKSIILDIKGHGTSIFFVKDSYLTAMVEDDVSTDNVSDMKNICLFICFFERGECQLNLL